MRDYIPICPYLADCPQIPDDVHLAFARHGDAAPLRLSADQLNRFDTAIAAACEFLRGWRLQAVREQTSWVDRDGIRIQAERNPYSRHSGKESYESAF